MQFNRLEPMMFLPPYSG